MKLLHVLASGHLGGAERICLYLAREQLAQGHDAHLHLMAAGDVLDFLQSEKLPYTLSEVDEALPKAQRWKQGAAGIAQTALEFGPDLVHSHLPLTHLLCHRTLPTMELPWIATIHGSWRQFGYSPESAGRPLRKSWNMLRQGIGHRLSTASAARIVAVSEHTKSELLRLGIPAARVRVILNGLPEHISSVSRKEARSHYGLLEKQLVIGTMGYLAPVKGFDTLIDGFAAIADEFPQAVVLIAGGDVFGNSGVREMLQNRITDLKLSDRVRMIGPVDIRQGFLSALDIFALSSRTEGLPGALVEAMQHGLPSMISSAGGSREAARPDQESLMFRTSDPRDLAAKLKQLLEEEALRKQLGDAARNRATKTLSIARCTRDYLQLCEEVISEKHE